MVLVLADHLHFVAVLLVHVDLVGDGVGVGIGVASTKRPFTCTTADATDPISTELCKISLLSSKNHPQNVPPPTTKLQYGAIFQPAIPETWQECFYTTLYNFGCAQVRSARLLHGYTFTSWRGTT